MICSLMIGIAQMRKGEPMLTIDKTQTDAIIDELFGNNDLTASPTVWYGLHRIKTLPVTEIITCADCVRRRTMCDGRDRCAVLNVFVDSDGYCKWAERRTDG